MDKELAIQPEIKKLSKQQKTLIGHLVRPELNLEESLKAARIDMSTYMEYLGSDIFVDALEVARKKTRDGISTKIDSVLISKCLKGDNTSIKTFYELKGDLGQEQEMKPISINFNIPRPPSEIKNITPGKDTGEK